MRVEAGMAQLRSWFMSSSGLIAMKIAAKAHIDKHGHLALHACSSLAPLQPRRRKRSIFRIRSR